MRDYTDQYSCRTCIWNEQCENETPCSFHDDGRSEIDLSDTEIENQVESGRRKYEDEFSEYVKEFDDGKYYE